MEKMMDHTIKVNRAVKISGIGAHPRSAMAMLAAIPDDVIDALPARLIASLLDANWSLAQQSKAIAEVDAIRDGVVWDAAGNRHRQIAA